jgi:hydroxymethylbilane synthase
MTESQARRDVLRIGTRGSRLALIQADAVKARLAEAHEQLRVPGAIEIVPIRTTGDREQGRALAEIGGKGLFAKEIEDALRNGRIDIAVHSMKDMETQLADGMTIGAMLPREDPRDVLIVRNDDKRAFAAIADLPEGARIGTASLRRRAQLLARRPDLEIGLLRGNVETRLSKLAAGAFDATLLALAGLKRLGLDPLPGTPLDPADMLPAAGQGAIGVEFRAADNNMARMLAAIDDPATRLAVDCERACLAVLDGSCHTPIAVYAAPVATAESAGNWHIRALVALPDGSQIHRAEGHAEAAMAVKMGDSLGRQLKDRAGREFFAKLETS